MVYDLVYKRNIKVYLPLIPSTTTLDGCLKKVDFSIIVDKPYLEGEREKYTNDYNAIEISLFQNRNDDCSSYIHLEFLQVQTSIESMSSYQIKLVPTIDPKHKDEAMELVDKIALNIEEYCKDIIKTCKNGNKSDIMFYLFINSYLEPKFGKEKIKVNIDRGSYPIDKEAPHGGVIRNLVRTYGIDLPIGVDVKRKLRNLIYDFYKSLGYDQEAVFYFNINEYDINSVLDKGCSIIK